MRTLSEKTVKARKNHKCNFCELVIPKGEVYKTQNNKRDGEFYTWKSHVKCDAIASGLDMYERSDEGQVNEQFFQECIIEYYNPLTYIDNLIKARDFLNKPWKEKLDYVCDFHLKEPIVFQVLNKC